MNRESVPCTGQMRNTRLSSSQLMHCTKTVQAAIKLSSLISLPGSLVDHSPFFVCAVALSAMVNLSALSLGPSTARMDTTKEHIILSIGALKLISETWSVAIPILKETKRVARNIFNTSLANCDLFRNPDDNQSPGSCRTEGLGPQIEMENVWPEI